MIIVGIGANLNHPEYGSPRRTCGAALEHLSRASDVQIRAVSRWYQSEPVLSLNGEGAQGEQPWYVNGATSDETDLEPLALLELLNRVEAAFGRVRSVANAPRTLDLDLIAYDDQHVQSEHLTVPHPRLIERAFVILPMIDLAPDWRHPVSGVSVAELRDLLPPDQAIEPLPPAQGLCDTEWIATPL